MARSRKFFTAGAVGVAALALVAASTSVTGAYFSEAKAGGITGNIGAVHLNAAPTTFVWKDMMPGEQKTATVNFRNTGTGPQDFYLVFPNVPALHALNNLGSYGEVHVTGGQTGNVGLAVFDSKNLQDGRHTVRDKKTGLVISDRTNTCGTFSPTGCWPLPVNLKIASNVAIQGTGALSFSFTYDGRIGNGTSGGVGAFNSFPLGGDDVFVSPYGDADTAATAGSSGLPFKVVAVQVGQTP